MNTIVQEDETNNTTSFIDASDAANYSTSDVAETHQQQCPWKCELTNEAGYVVYSALGSFYLPMFVMLFFYWRIYKAAVRTTRAINQGFRTTKGKRITENPWGFLLSELDTFVYGRD
ncbi:hypothetical protein HHI36_008601 [Cryptolaemus montrouzieri]|uniref:Uncharacterized protein n=1 Tax=Cryptolaemus montrouzieri TaxID=559131 RepID=A0ABD2MSY1_9CUCU